MSNKNLIGTCVTFYAADTIEALNADAETVTIAATQGVVTGTTESGALIVATADAETVTIAASAVCVIAEAETPAPLDIPAAVREYIEAEWRGAALVMSAKRGEIIAALLAADPELSNTAATFRFHKLVAEMRDNDSIEPQSAEPQYVTAEGPEGSGIRWHLMDADGTPVTAGEHRAMWSGQPRFTIAERPEVQSWDGEVPLNIWVMWVDDTRGYCRADQLVDAWHWELEVTEA